MPSPQELVEVVKGDAETLALQEWDLCVKTAARNDQGMLSELSSGGEALHLVGGLHKLRMAKEEDQIWLKKEFVSMWKSTPADIKSLPQPLRFWLRAAGSSAVESAIAQKFPVTQFDHQLKFTDIAARIVQVAGVQLEELSWLLMAENNCIVLPLQVPQIRKTGVLPLFS